MKRIALLTIAICGCFCSYNKVSAQALQDWADFTRYTKANEELKGKNVDIVLLGDSITDFWLGNDQEFFAETGYTNRGISGQTTSEMLVRYRRDVLELKPKVVAILGGINDIAGNHNQLIRVEDTFRNLKSMYDLARYNGIVPVVCSVLPCDRFEWLPDMKGIAEKVAQLNSMLKAYAESEGLIYVDYYSAMKNDAGGMDLTISNEGCHPNRAGYDIMKPLLMEGIAKASGKKTMKRILKNR